MGVLRLDITERVSPALDGMSFGDVGAYERLSGRAYCDLDPEHPSNSEIVNLDKAPRNGAGRVEYAVDFAILKPIALERGNGWLFYEYLNRGVQRGVVRINNAAVCPIPLTAADAGDGFLMRQGHSLVWTAWQGDVTPGAGRLVADFPIASHGDQPLIGQAREEVVLDAPDSIRGSVVEEVSPTRFILSLTYPAAAIGSEGASLTARARPGDPRAAHAGVTWRYLDDRRIEVDTAPDCGLDRGAIYEFVYAARDPIVMGIGYASIRDIVAFLRHDTHDQAGQANPLAPQGHPAIRRALGFGLSQSGRVLRDFIYQGFNADLQGRPVFDGAVPIIGGSRKAWVNAPFSQPGRYSRQHEEHDFPGDQFPFTYVPLFDSISGRTEGVLDRARAAGVSPKLMHMDTDSEVWSARASLIVTDTLGEDITMPDDIRVYLTTSIAHGDYPLPSAPVVEQATNPLTYGPIIRALLAAMVAWVDHGTEPPASAFPSRAEGTLLSLKDFRTRFPHIPAMPAPDRLNTLNLRDEDGQVGAAYPVFVPAVDADGNGVSGVRHPLVQAPVGTHTGWTLRASGFAQGDLYSVYGAFRPFPTDETDREATLDPRPSLQARYVSHNELVERMLEAGAAMVREGYMLEEDLSHVREQARSTPHLLPRFR